MKQEDKDQTQKTKTALLNWHHKFLIEAYKPRSFLMISSWDAQKLCDDILDAAIELEKMTRIVEALMKETTSNVPAA